MGDNKHQQRQCNTDLDNNNNLYKMKDNKHQQIQRDTQKIAMDNHI